MKKAVIFKGASTALITPTEKDGINYDNFKNIIENQISSGISALIVCGTTGEAATLRDSEKSELIRFAVKQAAGRVPVIAGTGSNFTEHAEELTSEAQKAGAAAALVVTPYYNKATQKGLIEHFSKIADVGLPIILYNVPTRTGINIEPVTYAELSKHENICGAKESGTNIAQISETVRLCGNALPLYSGNDNQITALFALGAIGVVSVLANLLPAQISNICKCFMSGQINESIKLQLKLLPLMEAMFSEVNPIPIKTAMAYMGYCSEYFRLPMTKMNEAKKDTMIKLINEFIQNEKLSDSFSG